MKNHAKPKNRSITESQKVRRLVAQVERLKKERKEIEEKYRNMFEYANDAIITSNTKGIVTSFNKKAEEMYGYKREEIIGKSTSILIPTKKQKEEKEAFKRILCKSKSGLIGSIKEGTGLTKGGQTFPVEGSYYAFQANGEYNLIGIFRDISERKKLEETLQASEERSRVLLNAPPDIALMVDNKGILIDCNDALAMRFNKSREELLGNNPHDLFDRNVANARKKILKKVFSDGVPVCFQDKHRGKWFDHSVHPIFNAQGKVAQAVIFAHEITELKQQEEEIASARDKLKALANEVATIEENARRNFSNYLHDKIGQTLFVLKIRLEMLAKTELGNEPTEKWNEIFKLMAKVINDTRTLSYEMSPAMLNELGFDAALEWLVDKTNKQYDVSVDFRSDHKSRTMDEGICALLYRAASELLTNVVKHARAKYVSVSIRNDDHQVQLEIGDDGVGFDTEILESLPDDNKGFGLFSIKERLKWINGDMDIKSAPGQGTHITLRVPL